MGTQLSGIYCNNILTWCNKIIIELDNELNISSDCCVSINDKFTNTINERLTENGQDPLMYIFKKRKKWYCQSAGAHTSFSRQELDFWETFPSVIISGEKLAGMQWHSTNLSQVWINPTNHLLNQEQRRRKWVRILIGDGGYLKDDAIKALSKLQVSVLKLNFL